MSYLLKNVPGGTALIVNYTENGGSSQAGVDELLGVRDPVSRRCLGMFLDTPIMDFLVID